MDSSDEESNTILSLEQALHDTHHKLTVVRQRTFDFKDTNTELQQTLEEKNDIIQQLNATVTDLEMKVFLSD